MKPILTTSDPKGMLWADVHVEHSVKSNNIKGAKQSALVVDVLRSQIEEEKPDYIVVLGDFFDAFGRIDSTLAVAMQEEVDSWAANGTKVIFIAGNHEYESVREEFFGKSVLTALFGNKESSGIYVIDHKARFIRLTDSLVLLGVPYRETLSQFQETCWEPITEAARLGEVNFSSDKILVGWHVGLPLSTVYRGDELPNEWITTGNRMVRALLRMADKNRVWCGHYHGPGDTEMVYDGHEQPGFTGEAFWPAGLPEETIEAGDTIGVCTYVGSPATRSRTESGQDKRICVLDGLVPRFVSTSLQLDSVHSSVKAAKEHLTELAGRFGEEVLHLATAHVALSEGASLDDYYVARTAATGAGHINVIRPQTPPKSKISHIIEKHEKDPSSSKEQMELEIALFALRLHFTNDSLKDLPDATFRAIEAVGYPTWKELSELSVGTLTSEDFNAISLSLLTERGAMVEGLPQLTSELCATMASYSLATEELRQITLYVSK